MPSITYKLEKTQVTGFFWTSMQHAGPLHRPYLLTHTVHNSTAQVLTCNIVGPTREVTGDAIVPLEFHKRFTHSLYIRPFLIIGDCLCLSIYHLKNWRVMKILRFWFSMQRYLKQLFLRPKVACCYDHSKRLYIFVTHNILQNKLI